MHFHRVGHVHLSSFGRVSENKAFLPETDGTPSVGVWGCGVGGVGLGAWGVELSGEGPGLWVHECAAVPRRART